MDNCCCNGTPAVGVPFPYFSAFTVSPPVVPDFYWNVYSQEERIKAMCIRLGEFEAYVDELVVFINDMYGKVVEMEGTIDEINKKLQMMEAGSTYGELKDNGFIYLKEGE